MKINIFGKEVNIIWFGFAFISILFIIFVLVVSLPPHETIDPIIGIWKYETSENATILTFDGIYNFKSDYYSKIIAQDPQIIRGCWTRASGNYYNITLVFPDRGIGHTTFVRNPDTDLIYGITLPDHLFKKVRG